ncbi:hypothetical protein BRADI_3g57491v3 [Brachypodium distachyon]|uniref:Uncharacterized protein n=1 Tax=Brachypodium distachyon TaxID=15368 RepID=A0A2K2D5I8_BRADI|nr:hypothetical protein BRADI_3g57491v3 [Brachypodium distachyon]
MTLQPCRLCQFRSPVDLTLALALPSPAPPQGDVVALAQLWALWQYWLLGGAGGGRQRAAAAAEYGQARYVYERIYSK